MTKTFFVKLGYSPWLMSSSRQFTGSGILPYSVTDTGVKFLFQTTFTGKKKFTLLDFGGKIDNDSDLYATACREFCEETYGVFSPGFNDENTKALINSLNEYRFIGSEFSKAETTRLIDLNLNSHFGYTLDGQYCLFFMEIKDQDLNTVAPFFEGVNGKKKRLLQWIDSKDLLERNLALPLHARISNIVGLDEMIKTVMNSNKMDKPINEN